MLDVRNETETKILQTLARHGAQSRAEIAREIGVTRSAVAAPTSRLVALGILRQAELDSADDSFNRRSGRPGAPLELASEFCVFAGVDVSYGAIRVGLYDMGGEAHAFETQSVDPSDQTPEKVEARIVEMLRAVSSGHPDLAGIAISVPGIVDDDGLILRIPTFEWQDVDLAERVHRHFPSAPRIIVRNDAFLFAGAQIQAQPDQNLQNAIHVWLDAGIGGGIVANGNPVLGRAGFAGEIGHIMVTSLSGKLQRLEDIAGSRALLHRARALGSQAQTISAFIANHAAGHAAETTCMREWSSSMAQAMASLTSILDPEAMIFSGPVAVVLENVKESVFDEYNSLLLHGTQPAEWQILPYEETILARNGALLLRSSMFRSHTA